MEELLSDVSLKVLAVCLRLADFYNDKGDHGKSSEICQGLLDSDWLTATARSHVTFKKKSADAVASLRIAENYRSQGNLSRAMDHMITCCTLAQESGNMMCMQSALCSMGLMMITAGKPEQAIELFQQHLYLAQAQGDTHSQIIAYKNLANVCQMISSFAQGIQYAKQGLAITQGLQRAQSEAEFYIVICHMYDSIGKPQEAINHAKTALSLAKEHKLKRIEGQAHACLGDAYYSIAKFDDSLKHNEKFLEIAQGLDDKKMVAQACTGLGLVHHSRGDNHIAIPLHEQALKIDQELGDRRAEGKSYGNLGNAAFARSDYTKAREYYNKCLEIAVQFDSKQDQWMVYHSLGNTFYFQDDFRQALEHQKKALDVARAIGARGGEASALGGIGNVYYALGEYDHAIEYYQQALPITVEVGDRIEEGNTYGNLGNCYDGLEKYDDAIEKHKKHLEIARDVGNKPGESRALCNLGIAYYWADDIEKALEKHNEHLKVAMEIGDKLNVSRCYGNFANCFKLQRNTEKAIEFYRKQAESAKEIGSSEGEATSYYNVGTLHKSLENWDDAYEAMKKCIEKYEEIRVRMRNEDSQKVSIGDKHVRAHKHLALILLEQKKLKEAFLAADRGRAVALNDLLRSLYNVTCDESHEALVLAEERKTEDHLASLYHLTNVTMLSFSFLFGTLYIWVAGRGGLQVTTVPFGDEFIEKFVKLIRSALSSVESARDSECLEERDMAETQIGDELAEDFFALHQDKLPTRKHVDMEGNEENKQAGREACSKHTPDGNQYSEREDKSDGQSRAQDSTRCVLPESDEEEEENPLSELYNILIKPVEESIQGDHLLIIPESALYCIPYSALVDTQGKYLSERFSVQVSTSLRTLAMHNGGGENLEGALVIGNPTLGQVMVRGKVTRPRDLPGALKEAQDVAKCFNATPLVQARATRPLVLQYLPRASVIHIAAHGDSRRGEIYLAPSWAPHTPQKGASIGQKGKLTANASVLGQISEDSECSARPQVADSLSTAKRNDTESLLQTPEARGRSVAVAPARGLSVSGSVQRENNIKVEHSVKETSSGLPNNNSEFEKGRDNRNSPEPHFPKETTNLEPPTDREGFSGETLPSEEDFLLTCSDIAKLHLRARLVVLSCCQTASGKIRSEGVVGIARSFLGAGASAVLVTMWAISDDATQIFMENFYKFLLEGFPCCAAVRISMEEMRRSEKFKGAANWAPFYVIGHDVKFSKSEVMQIRSNSLFH
ncbi:tetratricopeptide repeat protein 28 [Nematostella vectensis]|uniref:tetratricopeptide repeat protein 28 n=1 Tax=Nematostella vectensis TaxID=45351 RepID=UPI0020771407|nr:tetratricopeptide repeat protein 28 [Nematostella vectensis]